MPLSETRCPHCGFSGRVPPESKGKSATCRQCRKPFTVAFADQAKPRARSLALPLIAGLAFLGLLFMVGIAVAGWSVARHLLRSGAEPPVAQAGPPEKAPIQKEDPKPQEPPAKTSPSSKNEAPKSNQPYDLLPVSTRESTDPALPGTWHILDRNKPITKLIDRDSLVRTGPKTLVLLERSVTMTLQKQSRSLVVLQLPFDVGNEQFLLGCLPRLEDAKGKAYRVDLGLFQLHAPRYARLVEVVPQETLPQNVPLTLSLKVVVLAPPPLTRAEKETLTASFLKQPSKERKNWDGTAGFPAPEFRDGGLAYLNVTAAETNNQTIHNALMAAVNHCTYSVDPGVNTEFDPDAIKKSRKGACGQRSRLAEKVLTGYSRGIVVGGFFELVDDDAKQFGRSVGLRFSEDYPSGGHGGLFIEDPATGKYLVGDQKNITPLNGALICDHVIRSTGAFELVLPRSGLPVKQQAKLSQQYMFSFVSNIKYSTQFNTFAYVGSSRCGKNQAKYQTWLKNAPREFQDFADKINAAGR